MSNSRDHISQAGTTKKGTVPKTTAPFLFPHLPNQIYSLSCYTSTLLSLPMELITPETEQLVFNVYT